MFNQRIWQVKTLSQEIVDARLLKQQQWLVPSLFHQYNSSSPSMAAIGKHISWFVDCGHPSKWLYLLTVTDDTCICDFPKPREKNGSASRAISYGGRPGREPRHERVVFRPAPVGSSSTHPPSSCWHPQSYFLRLKINTILKFKIYLTKNATLS